MKEKTFEELMEELDKIVKELENGDADLETSIEKYTTAMKLLKTCGDKLNKAQESVNKILNYNGQIEDFQIEDNQ